MKATRGVVMRRFLSAFSSCLTHGRGTGATFAAAKVVPSRSEFPTQFQNLGGSSSESNGSMLSWKCSEQTNGDVQVHTTNIGRLGFQTGKGGCGLRDGAGRGTWVFK